VQTALYLGTSYQSAAPLDGTVVVLGGNNNRHHIDPPARSVIDVNPESYNHLATAGAADQRRKEVNKVKGRTVRRKAAGRTIEPPGPR